MSTILVGQLSSTGDIVGGFGNLLSHSAATAQKLRSRLKLNQAEYFLDLDAGVPWFAIDGTVDPPIMGRKGTELGYAERVLKTTILETVGVSKLVSFSITLNRNTRAATVAAIVETDDGDIENIEVILP